MSGESYKSYVTFTPEELKQMHANAEEWLAEPEKIEEWASKRALIYIQMLDRVAQNPPAGRSGPTSWMRAVEKVIRLCDSLLEQLDKRRRQAEGQGPGGEEASGG